MAFSTFGLLPLVMLLTGTSLPLAMPPLPEDPAISRAAPETCLAYMSWAGTASPDAKSANQTEQLLAEPEVQKFVAAIDAAIRTSINRDIEHRDRDAMVAKDVYGLAKIVLTRPGAVFIEKLEVGCPGPPLPQGGAIVNLADQAVPVGEMFERYENFLAHETPGAKVEKIDIEGASFHRIAGGLIPPFTWGIRDGYLIIGLGDGSAEAMVKRLKGEPPAWLTAAKKQLPVGRVSTVTYFDVKQALATLPALAGSRAMPVADAIGLGNVQSVACVTGLDDTAFVSRTLIGIDGEPQGIFRLASARPLAAADLAPIPRDATIAFAGRLDANAALELLLNKMGEVDPDARKDFVEHLAKLSDHLGVDVQEDVLKSLGDVWCVYNSPSEGGLLITGLTGVVQVKDHDRLEAAIDKLMMLFHEREGNSMHDRAPRIVKSKFAGQTIYFVDMPLRDGPPIAPAWCLTEKELIVAPFPQQIKAYLARPKDAPSIAAAPEVAEMLKDGGAVSMSYCDTRKVAECLYPLACIAGPLVSDEMRRGNLEFDVSAIPSAAAILPHLRPSVSFVRRTSDGIEIVSQGPIGGIGMLNLLPLSSLVLYGRAEPPPPRRAIEREPSLPPLQQKQAVPRQSMDVPPAGFESPARDLSEHVAPNEKRDTPRAAQAEIEAKTKELNAARAKLEAANKALENADRERAALLKERERQLESQQKR